MTARDRFDTHEVLNQSPPYVDVDLFTSDRPLRDAVEANDPSAELPELSIFGRHWGSAELIEQGRLANENPPKLKIVDQKGFRCDVVEFHPAYHRFMAESIAAGIHAATWQANGTRATAPTEVARAARFYMATQIEAGHLCPITMTRASVASLAAAPELRERLMPRILSRDFDPRFRPWWEKQGITLGMGMTEKQGGTDVRANTTRAVPAAEGYELTGHKWFMSAPMCDAFLVLGQAPGGLTCFLMPRFRPDGAVNGLRFQRLKDKLGNRSNASSEVEFVDAFAWPVGAEGRGVRTIIEMVQLTRLDCAIGSAGLMRMALAQAIHHARHRSVFQKRLIDHPMMRTVLADLGLEMEATVALVMRLCRSFDLAVDNSSEAARARLLTPAVKYLVCKSAPAFIYEAMECLGGNGYVEDGVLARLYREAPVNAIWEGSGNVMCLDVLRAFGREGDAGEEVLESLQQEARGIVGAAPIMEQVRAGVRASAGEGHARNTVERLARLAACAALAQGAPSGIAEAYARTRLQTSHGCAFGAVDLDGGEIAGLLERALPLD
jgi:putative acyl-CoA dehydrogenase